jgi:hypothetical protein
MLLEKNQQLISYGRLAMAIKVCFKGVEVGK